MNKQDHLKGICFIVGIIFIMFLFGQLVDLNFVNEIIEGAGIWAPLLFIFAKISTIVVAPLVGTPLYLLVGTVFGFWEGVAYVLIADTIGFTILFWVSRKWGIDIIKFFAGKKETEIIHIIRKQIHNIPSFIKTCLIFFWFPEASMAAAGLSDLSYVRTITSFMIFYTIASTAFIYIGTVIL